MKVTFILLFVFIVASYESHSQNLFNNKPDSLEHHETFYYTTLKDKRTFKQSLASGFYVLIFAESVDLKKLNFNINQRYDAPIIYVKHNGFFSFMVREPVVTAFEFDYEGNLSLEGSFARLYRESPMIIGTPYPDFTLKEINGKEINKNDLIGNVTLFLLWNPEIGKSQKHYQLLNDLATDYQEVNFVALSDALPSKIHNFNNQHPDSNFLFANDKFQKLGDWTNLVPGNGSVIFIIDKNGLLEYKNMISQDHSIFQQQLKNKVEEKLNSLL